MATAPRTVVTFESSAFNITEPRSYFINPCCYGDDLANWLRAQLEAVAIKCGPEIGQEDFGWYMDFVHAGKAYGLIIGHREDEQGPGQSNHGQWVLWLQPLQRGFLSIFQSEQKKIDTDVLKQLNAVLNAAPEISNVRWHTRSDFDHNLEERGTADPLDGTLT